MAIMLQDVLPIENLRDYKIHFAVWNQVHQLLDVFTRDRLEWQKWQEYRGQKDEFNRQFIFALADFYHEPGTWLFGGIYEVTDRSGEEYAVNLSDFASPFIGRLRLAPPIRIAAMLASKWRVNTNPLKSSRSSRSRSPGVPSPATKGSTSPSIEDEIFPSQRGG